MSGDVSIGPRPGPGWVSVTRGAHRLRSTPDAAHVDLHAWQAVLPASAGFTHLTAAELLGMPMPPLPAELPTLVAMDRSTSPERRGLRVSRHHDSPEQTLIHGLRVTMAAETLLACARDLSLLDLVVLVDDCLHRGLASPTQLRSVAQQRRRGAPQLRNAFALADGRAESPWETMLRILHVICDIPVEPQYVVKNASGQFVARGDLWIVGTRTLHEYDGGHHLLRQQQRCDLKRSAAITDADWTRRGFVKEDVLHQASTIIRAADRALGRDHDPSRVRLWNALLRDSLHTPPGQARFRARLRLPPN